MIVGPPGPAAPGHLGLVEEVEILREVLLHPLRHDGHVPRRRHLTPVGQTMRIAEGCLAHAHGAGALGHPPGKGRFGAGDALGHDRGNVIRRAHHQRLDGIADGDGLTGPDAQFRRRLAGRAARGLELGIQRVTPRIQLLKEHVERHHLSQGRRIAACVGIAGKQDFPRHLLHHKRGIFRIGGGGRRYTENGGNNGQADDDSR